MSVLCVPGFVTSLLGRSDRTVMGTGEVGGTRETARPAALECLDTVRYDADEVLQGLVEDTREAFETDLCVLHRRCCEGGPDAELE